MCIAIYKPAGIKVPSDEIITRCWDANDDGAGVGYPTADGIQIFKGFGSAQEMIDFLKSQPFESANMLIHFRIGTHGDKTGAHHTHPFPIGKSVKEMEDTNIIVDRALIHNGILYQFGYDKAISDTMAFARDVATDVLALSKLKMGKQMIESILGTNKLAVMERDGSVVMYGNWIFDEGIYWSNQSYKAWASAASCDPRKWQQSLNSTAAYRDDDYVFVNGKWMLESDLEDQTAEPFDMGYNQFYSDMIFELTCDSMDVNDEGRAHIKIMADALKIPVTTRQKPIGLSAREWDTWVTSQYLEGELSWHQFLTFCNENVIPEETDNAGSDAFLLEMTK